MEHVELPGGLIRDGQLCRSFKFRPVNGMLELALIEANRDAPNLPAGVTRQLQAALTDEQGMPLDTAVVSDMSVGDRQFLVYQLAGLIDDSPRWVSLQCQDCKESFDISYRFLDVPIKAPDEGYPSKDINAGGRTWRVRVPTGRDQARLSSIQNEAEAERQLLGLLIQAPAGVELDELGEDDLAEIESAIESISPELADRTVAVCPECGHENVAYLEPWPLSTFSSQSLLTEVHNIAIHYHWSEAEILALPRQRRRHYLSLIDISNGLHNRQRMGG